MSDEIEHECDEDMDQRGMALNLAATMQGSQILTTDQIVARAQAFYNFVTGAAPDSVVVSVDQRRTDVV